MDKEKLIKSIEETEQRLNELKEELKDCDTGYRPKKGEPVLYRWDDKEHIGVCLRENGSLRGDAALIFVHMAGTHDSYGNYAGTFYEGKCWWALYEDLRKLPEIP